MPNIKDFRILNIALKNFVKCQSNKRTLALLDVMERIAIMILEHREFYDASNEYFHEHMDINESISLVEGFLHSIHPDYYEQFYNIMRDTNLDPETGKKVPVINFHSTEPLEYNDSKVDSYGDTQLCYYKTIQDAFALLHEMFHEFAFPARTWIKDFFDEVVPFTAELLFEDYLNTLGLNNSEINKHKKNRLLDSYTCAARLVFEKHLIDLYLRKGKFSCKKSLLESLHLNEDSIIHSILLEHIDDYMDIIVKDGELSINRLQKYALGVIVAYYLYVRILGNPKEMETLRYLNHSIGDANAKPLQVMKDTGLDFFSVTQFGQVVINEELMEQFRISFDSELSRIDMGSADKRTI